MKDLKVVWRLVYCGVFAALCLLVTWFVVGEMTTYGYMHHYSIADRADLSEDYGFGMVAFLVEGMALLVSMPFALLGGWRMSDSTSNGRCDS